MVTRPNRIGHYFAGPVFYILLIQSNPVISKSQGKWKKVRNSGVSKYPGKRKIRNSESSFNKIQCIIKKDTD